MAIWYVLWPFGIFYGNFGTFCGHFGIFYGNFGTFCGHFGYMFPVLVYCTKNNLATLL
jgi:hypothetical protein